MVNAIGVLDYILTRHQAATAARRESTRGRPALVSQSPRARDARTGVARRWCAGARWKAPHQAGFTCWLLLLLFAAGCASGGGSALADRTPPSAAAEIGRSVEGRPLVVRSLGTGPDVVLFIATIHGDEAAGTPLLDCLARAVEADPALLAGRRAILVPVANPDGQAAVRRFNARGVDLNRNFPAGNFDNSVRHGAEPLSEPESRFLHDLVLIERPARIVSIHQPLSCVDWDGPAEDLARAMSAASDLPAKRVGSRPGSMGSWAGLTLGIPIITLELPRSASALSEADAWARYGPMLLVALRGGADPSP